jgi:hypothetical protein
MIGHGCMIGPAAETGKGIQLVGRIRILGDAPSDSLAGPWKWVRISGAKQLSSTGKYFLEIAEMEVKLGSGGANLCTGGTPYADSDLSSYLAAKAYDGNGGTVWSSAQRASAPTSWRADYKAAGMPFDRSRLLHRAGDYDQLGVRNGTLSVSNDSTNGANGTWTTIKTGINMSDSPGTWTEHVI